MKIINKITNETVATIIGGSNLTLDQALDLIGAVNVVDMDNDLYSNDGDRKKCGKFNPDWTHFIILEVHKGQTFIYIAEHVEI